MVDAIDDDECKIAGSLFGKDNLKNDSSILFASNPLALFCKDSKNGLLQGDDVNGFQSKFCNLTKIVQTDVGICVSSNPTQHLSNGYIHLNELTNKINRGLKEIEHTMIIQVDRFAHDSAQNFSVCIIRLIKYQFM